MTAKKKPTGGVRMEPEVIETFRQVSPGSLPPGDKGRGATYVHKIGESAPVVRAVLDERGPRAWVEKGTGDVIVIVQLFLVKPGGQGVPISRSDGSGSTLAHYEYWLSPEVVPIMNAHEEAHRKAIEHNYMRFIAPLLTRIARYQEPRTMRMPSGTPEADCRTALERYIDWDASLASYRLAFDEQDKKLDAEVNTRFGTISSPLRVTASASTDHLVVPYPVPPRWLSQPSA
jgi:hypothetical protein